MSDKGVVILQNYTDVKKVEPDLCGETYPASDYASQVMNIKVEKVSDPEEEEDPVPITFPKIKPEPEVSLRLYRFTVKQILQICRNAICLFRLHEMTPQS
jgi:hypothetical protein